MGADLLAIGMLGASTRDELAACNAATAAYGLSLTEEQAAGLAERRREALASTGRVEFGRGVLHEIARGFCDSPYVRQENYEDVLAKVQDVFYRRKEEAEAVGGMADDDLIEALRSAFDAEAGGSTDALEGVSLDALRSLALRRRAGDYDETTQREEEEREFDENEDATRRVGELWNEVCLAVPLLESVALRDTLESLRDFPARYEPRFFAHEIPADIDYPLAQPVPETALGVDYVEAYLEQLLAECRFLGRFDLARCRAVLRSIHPDYGELILNLFEPVATVAVGCALVGEPVRALRMSEAACARAASVVADASVPQMRELLAQAAERACDELGVDDVTIRESVRQVAVDLEPRVRTAARHGSLGGMFASSS